MRLNKFKKAPADRKRYVVDYTDWLNEAELITDFDATGNVPDDEFYIDGYIIDTGALQVIFYASGGVSGKTYDVTITITTTLAQVKQDYVTFVVT